MLKQTLKRMMWNSVIVRTRIIDNIVFYNPCNTKIQMLGNPSTVLQLSSTAHEKVCWGSQHVIGSAQYDLMGVLPTVIASITSHFKAHFLLVCHVKNPSLHLRANRYGHL